MSRYDFGATMRLLGHNRGGKAVFSRKYLTAVASLGAGNATPSAPDRRGQVAGFACLTERVARTSRYPIPQAQPKLPLLTRCSIRHRRRHMRREQFLLDLA